MHIICKDYIKVKDKPCLHYQNKSCDLPSRFLCIEYIRRKKPLLSPSMITTFTKCRRAFWYSYICGLQSIETNKNLLLGSIMHLILQNFHSGDSKFLEKQKSIMLNFEKFYSEEMTEIIKCFAILDVYKTLYKPDTGQCEVEFRKDNDRYFLRGFIDMIEDSKIYDFKYTSRPDSYTLFTTELQAGIYLLLTEKDSITFRIITKPSLKQKDDETDEEYYTRLIEDIKRRPAYYFNDITFYSSEYDFQQIEDYLEVVTSEIKRLVELDFEHYYQNRSACMCPHQCEFLPICEAKGLVPENLYSKRTVQDYDIF